MVVELVNFTCEWPNSELHPHLVVSLCRLVVIHSMAFYVIRHGHKSVTLEIFILCKLFPSHTGNSRQLHPGRRSVAHRMVGKGRELACLSWCGRKSLLLLGQLYTFCLIVCHLLSDIGVNASLRSDFKSLMIAHESKKSRIFQLVNWS